MKILIASDTYYPHANGASYFTQRLATHLRQKGHEVLVVAPGRQFHHEYFSHDTVKILGLPSVPLVGLKSYMRVAIPSGFTKEIEKAFQTFQPDVVHIQDHFYVGKTVFNIAK